MKNTKNKKIIYILTVIILLIIFAVCIIFILQKTNIIQKKNIDVIDMIDEDNGFVESKEDSNKNDVLLVNNTEISNLKDELQQIPIVLDVNDKIVIIDSDGNVIDDKYVKCEYGNLGYIFEGNYWLFYKEDDYSSYESVILDRKLNEISFDEEIDSFDYIGKVDRYLINKKLYDGKLNELPINIKGSSESGKDTKNEKSNQNEVLDYDYISYIGNDYFLIKNDYDKSNYFCKIIDSNANEIKDITDMIDEETDLTYFSNHRNYTFFKKKPDFKCKDYKLLNLETLNFVDLDMDNVLSFSIVEDNFMELNGKTKEVIFLENENVVDKIPIDEINYLKMPIYKLKDQEKYYMYNTLDKKTMELTKKQYEDTNQLESIQYRLILKEKYPQIYEKYKDIISDITSIDFEIIETNKKTNEDYILIKTITKDILYNVAEDKEIISIDSSLENKDTKYNYITSNKCPFIELENIWEWEKDYCQIYSFLTNKSLELEDYEDINFCCNYIEVSNDYEKYEVYNLNLEKVYEYKEEY